MAVNTKGQDISQAPGSVVPSGGLQAPPGGNINNTTGQTQLGVPAGWDAQTYANFQKANPGLQVNSEDTARMLGTPPSTITPGSLNTNPQPGNFQNAQTPPLYPTASLGSAYALTPEQQKAQEMTTSLEGLNTQLTGKAQDTINLYKQYGISTTTDAQGNLVPDAGTQDLQAKLKALQNEAQAIPLQTQNAYEGRGATAAGVQPIQDAQLRQNAIQALQTSSTIDAMNGNLQTAMLKVNAALTQKYGPIQAQISTLTNNLNLIKSSPEYDAETKAQAQQASYQLAQYQQSLQLQAQNYSDSQKAALSYAGSGATAQQLSSLQEIASKGGTAADVASAATQMGLQTLQTQAQQGQIQLQQAQIKQIPLDQALKSAQLAGANLSNEKTQLEIKNLKDAGVNLGAANTRTTANGTQYIDGTNLTGTDSAMVQRFAASHGIPYVGKDSADALNEISNAQLNQTDIINQIQGFLPKDSAGRVIASATVPLSKIFQTNDQIAAFNSWRTAAINSLRATAGSKGLRINQAEIYAATQNDIPQLTDTLGTAQQKFNNVQTLLQNAQDAILVPDKTSLVNSTEPTDRSKGAKWIRPDGTFVSDGSQWVKQ